jgi:alpha-galactosidase
VRCGAVRQRDPDIPTSNSHLPLFYKRMIRRIPCVIFLVLLNCSLLTAQSRQTVSGVVDPAKWVSTTFGKGKIPPFSFEYNGRPSSEFITKWKHSIALETGTSSDTPTYTVTYTDPVTKLQVQCKATAYTNYQAVDWTLHFTNGGTQNSAQITKVNAADLSLTYSGATSYHLYRSEGSNHDINDFRLKKTELKSGETSSMSPEGGRSSDKTAFPFFNIEAQGKGGVLVAIGWTGTWFAQVNQDDPRQVALQAGMKNLDLFLLPGESIRTPLISLTFWQGENFIKGHNRFRQLVLNHYSRKINGRFAEYPLSGGFEWGDPAPCNEYTCLTEEMAIAFVKRYKQFGIMPEVMWLDAGWYAGSGGPDFNGGNWYTTVGTWRVDTTRFPRGLKPISDATHKAGAKFMVWFEPERVRPGSEFATRFPDWMLKRKADKNDLLFNLGNKEAREWLSKYIGDFLEENGIDYYRQDFNMHANPFWEENEQPGRKGINEIRYIEGLYAYWDYLLQRFPNLVIDNCASGGRRLDLETTRRAAPLWRTDYSYGEPNGAQNHTYALNFYLPITGTGVFKFDDYSFHSTLSSALVVNWDLTSQDGNIKDMRRQIAQFKELRTYFYEDYFPLSGLGDLSTLDKWIAYQLNKPSDNSGIVVAFRRKDNKDLNYVVKLNDLDSGAQYDVTDQKTNQTIQKSGKELMEGLRLEIKDTPGSLVLKYHKK